jgi:hypothetical protein
MSEGRKRKTILILSQTFVPDPASVGQHMTDVALEMARRGHRVIVYTANRGYENPRLKYPARENLQGVEIRRLAFSSFGKSSLLVRAAATFSFIAQSALLALVTGNLRGIFFSTSPPLVGAAATFVAMIRRVPTAYWAMDLNPDQLVAMGKLKATSLTAKFLDAVHRFILRRAALVVALDRFMADRLRRREVRDDKLLVMPPWPHEDHIHALAPEESPFRARHGLNGKFVVMYSGNHSPANPLYTLLQAAVRLKEDSSLRFLFVGGGLGKKEVESCIDTHKLTNAISLPYQPLATLGESLSAADVHVVSLGQQMVGIVHPCKIYGAMAIGRPILYFGPEPSHIADLLRAHDYGYRVAHGDVEGAVQAIEALKTMDRAALQEKGETAKAVLQSQLSQEMLCRVFCDRLEQAFMPAAGLCAAGDSESLCLDRQIAAAQGRRPQKSKPRSIAGA